MLTQSLYAHPVARAADAAALRLPATSKVAVNVLYTARRTR